MPVNDTTSNRGYQKPNIANTLADDVGRLRSALDSIDTDMVGKASSTHTHGNITNAGAIGATANLPVITGTSGVLEAGSFGTTANTFCQGNDARLSDTRTPTDGSVSTAKLVDDAVTYAKIQNVSATDRLLGRSTAGAGDVEEITCTAAGRNLLDDADAAAQRATLGLGTLATQSGTFSGTSSGTNTGDQTITLTGDITGTGTGSFATAIASGVIVNADVNDSAAIAGTKISPDFGSQEVVTTGRITGASLIPTSSTAPTNGIYLAAANTLGISTNSTERMRITSGGDVVVAGSLQAASINSGPLAGFRNAIINGNFDVWQRGTSFSNPASNAFLADRWVLGVDGSGSTRTISRQPFTLGQTDVPGEPTYFLRYAQSVAGTGSTFNILQQRIEGVRTFAGRQVTVSFYAKASSSTTLPSISLTQIFGTGGSPSASVATTLVFNPVIGTSWAKYTYTTTLPSISGKTLGTDGNDRLGFVLGLPINDTFTVDIAQVQVEAGPVATPFERRPIGTELELCQRYYQVINGFLAGYTNTGVTESYRIPFRVRMRVNPTVIVSGQTNTNCTASSISPFDDGHCSFVCVGSALGGFIGTAAGSFSAEL